MLLLEDYSGEGSKLFVRKQGKLQDNSGSSTNRTELSSGSHQVLLSSTGLVSKTKNGIMVGQGDSLKLITNADAGSCTTSTLATNTTASYNTTTASNILKYDFDFVPKNGIFAWKVGKKVYELKDYLGNVRSLIKDYRAADGSGNPIAALEHYAHYYPFGMQQPGRNGNRYRFGFNGMEKVDEVTGSGNTVDMGDRWLNTRIGRTPKPDAKGNLFPGVSPYSYALNNPIIVIDPDGKKVKVMSEDAFNILLSSLSPEAREKIKVNKKGFIKRIPIKAALNHSNSENLKALSTLVNDKRTIELYTTQEEYDYISSETGETVTYEFEAPTRENTFQSLLDDFEGTPEEKAQYAEQLKSSGFEDEIEVVGNFGGVIRPADEQEPFPGGQISPSGNIRVYVNPVGTTGEEKAGIIGHELFGHAYFYIIGKDPRHGGSSGKLDGNQELEKHIDEREKESKQNFNK